MNPILVTGATGQQGSAVVRHLLADGASVRVMVRDGDGAAAGTLREQGCDVVVGDLDRIDSLVSALDGVSAAFLMLPMTDEATELRRGRQFIEAAVRAGLGYLLFSATLYSRQQTGVAHFDSKHQLMQELSDSGLHHTVLGPGGFMENLLYPQAWRGLAKGHLTTPYRVDVPQALVAVDDIGRFAAQYLRRPPEDSGEFIPLYADCLSSMEQAEVISRQLGRPVQAKRLPWLLTRLFLGAQLTAMFDYFNSAQADLPEGRQRFEEALNPPTRFAAWLSGQSLPT